MGFGLGLGVRVRVRVRVSAAEVDHPCEEGVHRADVVEHVLVVHRGAHEEDEEVEPPHHLGEAQQGEVRLDVVIGEVAEARHPHVGRDVQPDGVVDGRLLS